MLSFLLQYLESCWDGAGSWNEVVGNKSSNANHCQASVLQFLRGQIFSGFFVSLCPALGPVKGGLLVNLAGEGLALHLTTVLDALDDGTENDELCPPLWIGLEECLDGVGGIDRSIEGTNDLGEGPADGCQHGRTSVGQFSLTKMIDGCPL